MAATQRIREVIKRVPEIDSDNMDGLVGVSLAFRQALQEAIILAVKIRQVHVAMFHSHRNYEYILYIVATKAKAFDNFEAKLLDFVATTTKVSIFSQFMIELAVAADVIVKDINEIYAYIVEFGGPLASRGKVYMIV
ncbi:ATP synthase subunit O [Artemisia annua]|uniref:ATP synthase subunit O n=1 Tax=Artemisia annua TaxID=35608 RepID=A0A2U1KH49_ARTAN|nr:ATP synthase subunit O [Artemisia annua]